jgi:hypothetical protein
MSRPTKYKDTYPDQLYEHMKGGLSFESFGGVIGVSEETLHKWKNQKSKYFRKAFSESYKRGRTASMLHWEELGHDMVLAGQGNATAWIFNMKNRFNWKDKKDITTDDEKITGPILLAPKRNGRILDTPPKTTGGSKAE